MTRYLTTQEVLHLHKRTIERTGGRPGVRDVRLLEATLERPRAMTGGAEIYPTLPAKGAVLVYSLVANHLFVDGNTRLGFACLDAFLRLNGFRVKAEPEDAQNMLVQVSQDAMSIGLIGEWIEAHMEPLAPPKPKSTRRTPTRRVTITSPDFT